LRSLFISSTLLSLTSSLLYLKLSFVLNNRLSLTSITIIALISFNFLINFFLNFLINLLNADNITVFEILSNSNRDNFEISYIGITLTSFLLKRRERNLFLLSNILLSSLLLLLLITLNKLVICKLDNDLITIGRRDLAFLIYKDYEDSFNRGTLVLESLYSVTGVIERYISNLETLYLIRNY
jgi:hypothetical protein